MSNVNPYEKQIYITELLQISTDNFFDIFAVEHIVTKAVPAAVADTVSKALPI